MLTPKQIDEIQVAADSLMDDVINYLYEDIIRCIKEAGQITNTVEYHVWLLRCFGLNNKNITEGLNERLEDANNQINKLITEAAKTSYNGDIAKLGVDAVPFAENKPLQQLITGMIRMTDGDFTNITKTIGFIGLDGQYSQLTKFYRQASDYAFKMVSTGAMDYTKAVNEAARSLLAKGVKTVNYESGVITSIDAAVKRNVLSSIGNLTNEISEMNHDEIGATGWEISAHGACAADHEHIQGRQYTDKEFKKLNESLQRPIGTLNCGHIAYPIFIGKTKPVYTEVELEQMREKNKTGVAFEGKHYTEYEATQKQREIERKIKTEKRKLNGYKALGNKEQETAEKVKINRLYSFYNSFSKKCGLTPRYGLMRV